MLKVLSFVLYCMHSTAQLCVTVDFVSKYKNLKTTAFFNVYQYVKF